MPSDLRPPGHHPPPMCSLHAACLHTCDPAPREKSGQTLKRFAQIYHVLLCRMRGHKPMQGTHAPRCTMGAQVQPWPQEKARHTSTAVADSHRLYQQHSSRRNTPRHSSSRQPQQQATTAAAGSRQQYSSSTNLDGGAGGIPEGTRHSVLESNVGGLQQRGGPGPLACTQSQQQ
jgi:hypothetical protein